MENMNSEVFILSLFDGGFEQNKQAGESSETKTKTKTLYYTYGDDCRNQKWPGSAFL